MVGRWEVSEGRLVFDGLPASISQIREARDTIREHIPEIAFARRAPTPSIFLTGRFPSDIRADVRARIGNEAFAVQRETDHIVAAGVVYEIESNARQLILDALHDLPQSHNTISGTKYVALLTDSSLPNLLVDQVKRDSALEGSTSLDANVIRQSVRAELYEYQRVGVSAMVNLARAGVGSLLGDEMGLGKTLQAITVIAVDRRDRQCLIICPGSLIQNWRRELAEFAPTLSVAVHHGPNRRVLKRLFPKTDVVITTYDTAVSDVAFLEDIPFDFVVLDEAQMIRNSQTDRSAAVKRLVRRVGIAITGTPMENTLGDLWSIAQFVHPGILSTWDSFEQDFPDEAEAAERLGRLMSQVTIRRSLDDVAEELPPLVEQYVPFAMSSQVRRRYEAVATSGSGLEVNTTLLVVASHADQECSTFNLEPKNEYLEIQLEHIFARGEKAIIFGNYRQTLTRLRQQVSSWFDIRFVEIIDGSIDQDRRQLIVDEFTEWRGGAVLLLNPRAAGVGLNITAANHVFHYAPSYNPAVTRQATKRAHRNGQARTVFVHHLYYEETVEWNAVDIATVKADLADAVDRGLDEHDK
jgi:SNF2 family DNA or RNA helicase